MNSFQTTLSGLSPGDYIRVYTSAYTVDAWVEDLIQHEFRNERLIDVALQNDSWSTMGFYLTYHSVPSRPILHRIPQVSRVTDMEVPGGHRGQSVHLVDEIEQLSAATALAQK